MYVNCASSRNMTSSAILLSHGLTWSVAATYWSISRRTRRQISSRHFIMPWNRRVILFWENQKLSLCGQAFLSRSIKRTEFTWENKRHNRKCRLFQSGLLDRWLRNMKATRSPLLFLTFRRPQIISLCKNMIIEALWSIRSRTFFTFGGMFLRSWNLPRVKLVWRLAGFSAKNCGFRFAEWLRHPRKDRPGNRKKLQQAWIIRWLI